MMVSLRVFFRVAVALAAVGGVMLWVFSPMEWRNLASEGTGFPVTAQSKSSRDFAQQQKNWWERRVLPGVREKLKGKAWEATALEVIENGLEAWTITVSRDPDAGWLGPVAELERSGCDEPVSLYFAAFTHYNAKQDWRTADKLVSRARAAWAKDPKLPRAPYAWATVLASVVTKQRGSDTKRLDDQVVDLLAESLKAGEFVGAEQDLFVRNLLLWCGEPYARRLPDKIQRRLDGRWPLDEWARLTIDGWCEIRQTGGDRVRAAQVLTRAWELNPDSPVASGCMISLSPRTKEPSKPLLDQWIARLRGKAVPMREAVATQREWLGRSIAEECDYNPAHHEFRLRQPEGALEYAEACVAVGRFESDLPSLALNMIDALIAETPESIEAFRTARIRAVITKACEGMIHEPSRAAERPRRLSAKAVYDWLANDFEAATATLRQIEGGLHPAALQKLRMFGRSEAELRGEIELGRLFKLLAYRDAKMAYERLNFAEALAGAPSVDEKAHPAAFQMVQTLKTLCGVEKRLALGEWVDLDVDSALSLWTTHQGPWEEKAGALVLSHDDREGAIVYRGRLGDRFEATYTYHIDSGAGCCNSLCCTMGGLEPYADMATFSLQQRGSGSWNANWCPSRGRAVLVQKDFKSFVRGGENVVDLHVDGAASSWKLNGHVVAEGGDFTPLPALPAEAHFGFWNDFCIENVTTISKIRVRRLL
jgi:hypothetical protein